MKRKLKQMPVSYGDALVEILKLLKDVNTEIQTIFKRELK